MIKIDMSFQKNCSKCPFRDYEQGYCLASGHGSNSLEDMQNTSAYYEGGKPFWCPMIGDDPVVPIYKEIGIFCGKCNSYIRTCDTYCSSCGKKIEWASDRRKGE